MQEIVFSLIGGSLIGLAAAGLMWTNGRIMGVSGIVGGLLYPRSPDVSWRVLFLLGVVIGGTLVPQLGFTVMSLAFERDSGAVVFGGLLVGAGTAIGSGCTSGHGVCGISRFSARSLVATGVFIFFGVLSATFYRIFWGTL